MKHVKCILFFCIFSIILSACQSSQTEQHIKGHPAIDEINSSMSKAISEDKAIQNAGNASLSSDVSNALLPDVDVQSPDEQPLPKFDVSVNEISAQSFFVSLVKNSPYNIVVDPAIQGNISLHLKQVTVPEVMDALEDAYGYQFEVKKFGIYVTKGKLETRTFKVHYIDLQREGQSSTDVSSGQLTESTTSDSTATSTSTTTTDSTASASKLKTSTKSDFWKVLTDTITAMTMDTTGSKVIVNSSAGLVMVKAYPSTLNQVAKYLDEVQSIMTQQVSLEAKILQVTLDKEYQAGVDWNILGLSQDSSQAFTTNDNLNTFSSMFTLDMASGSAFSTVINLLGTEGNVQVLSSPRISTLNNQKAIIKVGHDQYYITNVSSTISGTDANETTQDVDLTPFFSGIALDVTPEISGNDDVILHIHPIISEVTDNTLDYTINGDAQELPSAASDIKETDNIVRAKNGQIVIIGGLMENETREYQANTPYASKIPLIGPLFDRTHQESVNSELVIMLKPVVVDNHNWTPQLESLSDKFKKLKRGYHYGPFPERFGNEAEVLKKDD